MKKLFSSLWSLVVTVLTIVGGAASIWFFWPVILIEPEFSSAPHGEPLQARFKISNESPIAIYDVTYAIQFTESAKPAGADDACDQIDVFECPVERLPWHASFTGAINIPLPPPIESPIMEVWVYYRLPFFSWRQTAGGRFRSMRDENGGYHWYPAGDAAEWAKQ